MRKVAMYSLFLGPVQASATWSCQGIVLATNPPDISRWSSKVAPALRIGATKLAPRTVRPLTVRLFTTLLFFANGRDKA
jgi:hypothetical protein